MKAFAATLLVLLLAAPLFAQSESDRMTFDRITVAPLQYRLDRLYFGAGVEERIFPNCRFTVARGKDLLYTGCIESSYRGVSMSSPTGQFFDTLALSDLVIEIERAPVDTSAHITLGRVGYLPLQSERTPTDSAPQPIIREFESPFEMSLAFEQQQLDGCFGYRKLSLPNAEDPVAQIAPFYVAILPNPSREVNRGGFLTTSLYYRLDPQRLPMYFDGDAIQPFHRLRAVDTLPPRPFPYSPSQGRTLLENIRSRPRSVSFSVEHPMLAAAAGYFADILSRDRFRTSVVDNPREADVRLVFVPLDIPEVATLQYIAGLLAADTVAGSPSAETIRIIDGYLRTAGATGDPSTREHYLMLAETSLRDDIGVLPLFRPTIFFTRAHGLMGEVFDPESPFNCAGLYKVRLPHPGGCEP